MIELTIIGAGLAGCEAAYQAAKRGIQVKLYEMRPFKMTPAHKTDKLAELVCSSSFKSQNPETAHGLLKSEMDKFGSLILDCARKSSVPGGDALCVDREKFSDLVTASIKENPLIEFINQEVTDVPTDKPCIIAAGPLVSESLALSLSKLTGNEHLHFFDAIAPSIDIETVDMNIAFKQSRYDKGEAAYFNCPMDKEEYYAFVDALVNAKIANMHLEEEKKPEYYEGCLPVEVMASRGKETLSFGMMKPVGLTDPRTGKRSYAVLQLRQENEEASVFGLVGCQTQLTISEQQRVFRLVPGLQNAKFVRYGAVHRNTYIESPKILNPTLNTRNNENLFFAGQISGVEGYMESTASGIIAGINASRLILGEPLIQLPIETMLGALLNYISNPQQQDFQPMNSNFGILPPLDIPHKKNQRKELKVERAVNSMAIFLNQ